MKKEIILIIMILLSLLVISINIISRAQSEYVPVQIFINESKPYYILYSNSGIYYHTDGPYNTSTYNNFQYDQIVIISSQYPFEVRINNETVLAKFFPSWGYYYNFVANKSMSIYIYFINNSSLINRNFTINVTTPWWAKSINSSSTTQSIFSLYQLNNLVIMMIVIIVFITIILLVLRKRK